MAIENETRCDICKRPVGKGGFLVSEQDLIGGMSAIIIAATGDLDNTGFDKHFCGKADVMAFLSEKLDQIRERAIKEEVAGGVRS